MRPATDTCDAIDRIPSEEWDALETGGNPFVRHAFLATLEQTGRVGAGTGWQPRHLVVRDRGRLVGAVPLYEKSHSWGEFVFDFRWAEASHAAGVAWYPKLVAAAPYTPVTGARLLVPEGGGPAARLDLARRLVDHARESGAPVAQVNFTTTEDQAALAEAGFLRRQDCRFLWRNRGYRDFEDFLDRFRADKRKKARRERRRVAEQGVEFETLDGHAVDEATWRTIFGFSERTFLLHGNDHYLSAEFFVRLSRACPGTIVVKLARQDGVPVAAAIFFRDDRRLYGRYWGADRHVDCLHFEACYYQGIEWCITHGILEFDPGTQGEHKLARGFEPTTTHSAHWIAHPGLAAGIARWLERERAAVDEYIELAARHLPYARDASS
ncbi:MAG: GNAT family N-acetyltransferase [Steroidobacteraceae bacterium]